MATLSMKPAPSHDFQDARFDPRFQLCNLLFQRDPGRFELHNAPVALSDLSFLSKSACQPFDDICFEIVNENALISR